MNTTQRINETLKRLERIISNIDDDYFYLVRMLGSRKLLVVYSGGEKEKMEKIFNNHEDKTDLRILANNKFEYLIKQGFRTV